MITWLLGSLLAYIHVSYLTVLFAVDISVILGVGVGHHNGSDEYFLGS